MRREAKRPLLVGTVILVFLSIFTKSGIVTFLMNELSAPLDVSQSCEALCPEEVDDYGFL